MAAAELLAAGVVGLSVDDPPWMGRRYQDGEQGVLAITDVFHRKLHCELPRVLVVLIQDSGSSCSVVSLTIVHELTLEPFETDLQPRKRRVKDPYRATVTMTVETGTATRREQASRYR